MKNRSTTIKTCAIAAALAASVVFPAFCRAQGTNPNFVTGEEQQQQTNQDLKERAMSGQKGSKVAPKVDPKESKAYKAFYDTSPQDTDQRIKLGEDFVKKYPSGPYTESVYAGLVQAYYVKQDWKNMYATADKALAINPDNVDVLVTVGWVIPHVYNPSEPNASQQLDKAQNYETKAIQDIPNLPKPANMTDEQFATAKAQKLAEAHSGLGLVYFRRQDYDKAAKELQLATQGNPSPDPTDYFALGAALQNTQQYSQAADAFDHCAQIAGSLQSQCKQYEDKAKQLAQGK
jgi:tetratricopeptide (TPR) repeat protein